MQHFHAPQRHWPWLVVLGWVVGYEGHAVLTGDVTLSERYWRLSERLPWLTPVMIVMVIGAACYIGRQWWKR